VERQLQHKRGEIADDLRRDVDIIQKREILRQSNLGKRLWKAAAGPDEIPQGHQALCEQSLEEVDDPLSGFYNNGRPRRAERR
jgi:hypothetical protein